MRKTQSPRPASSAASECNGCVRRQRSCGRRRQVPPAAHSGYGFPGTSPGPRAQGSAYRMHWAVAHVRALVTSSAGQQPVPALIPSGCNLLQPLQTPDKIMGDRVM
ncbi:hypothetical protein Mp_5g14390 [Marchantia polymorpha subsp. ruderalis]|uniref:Uncharacterized protein n=2 Tax=Marchantia polymorpha TaxID=3197 RepID=A0AAF6BIB5_MARPO|nr:hypothetical protein MARPO_0032s0132 [Marchantia polymorpha]BBN11749.1 hypothetical protein Mp_5g14390 [Marchantia polymorpha subsp. ruderalis]|eukprot:PTQ41967.1 hypothetical protein MARPO_0032s0132 [Marchantia polymorpha]